jgi:hypothetical protein
MIYIHLIQAGIASQAASARLLLDDIPALYITIGISRKIRKMEVKMAQVACFLGANN